MAGRFANAIEAAHGGQFALLTDLALMALNEAGGRPPADWEAEVDPDPPSPSSPS